MNRQRVLRGGNGYARDLGFDPAEYLCDVVTQTGKASWLDLCCGSGHALIEAATEFQRNELDVSIAGVDLVGMFRPNQISKLELTEASLSHWQPSGTFDLITCVHGLHYIGDKLGLLQRALSWLGPQGRFAANLDRNNLKLDGAGADDEIIRMLRKSGLKYDSRQHLLNSDGVRNVGFELQYLGADPNAGPNYTGQPAVDSWYQFDV